MSNEKKLHPEMDVLLQFVDGDLEEAAMEKVRKHVALCGDCHGWLNELESGITDYKQTWMSGWKAAADEPPKPWFDLRKNMHKLDRQPARVPSRRVWVSLHWAAAA